MCIRSKSISDKCRFSVQRPKLLISQNTTMYEIYTDFFLCWLVCCFSYDKAKWMLSNFVSTFQAAITVTRPKAWRLPLWRRSRRQDMDRINRNFRGVHVNVNKYGPLMFLVAFEGCKDHQNAQMNDNVAKRYFTGVLTRPVMSHLG